MNPTTKFTPPAPPQSFSVSRQVLGLLALLLLSFAAAGTAAFVSTETWYAKLNKPTWSPPAWIFGPVWTCLYAMMAVAAWLVWRKGGWCKHWLPLTLFLLQWLLNALWTPLFFGLHQPGMAFVDIVALWLTLIATVYSFWWVDKASGILLLPYLAWVSFAAVLNYTLWQMNP